MSTLFTIDTLSHQKVFYLLYNGIMPALIVQPWQTLLNRSIPRSASHYDDYNNGPIDVCVSRDATLRTLERTFIIHNLNVDITSSDAPEQSVPGSYGEKMYFLVSSLRDLQEADCVLKIKAVYSPVMIGTGAYDEGNYNDGLLPIAGSLRTISTRPLGGILEPLEFPRTIAPRTIAPRSYAMDYSIRLDPPVLQAPRFTFDSEAFSESSRVLRESLDNLSRRMRETTIRELVNDYNEPSDVVELPFEPFEEITGT